MRVQPRNRRQPVYLALAVSIALGLTACGDPAVPGAEGQPGTISTSTDANADTKAAATDGAWSAVGQWPFIPIHAAVLPDGRVLTYGSTPGGEQGGHLQYDIWDPNAGLGSGSHLTLPNTTSVDTFCSAGLVMPQSGNFITASGDWRGRPDGLGFNRNRDVLSFDYRNNSVSKLSRSINHQRWYGTMTMLPSGELLMQGGTCWQGNASVCDAGVVEATTPEIYRPGQGWRLLTGASSDTYFGAVNSRWWYPRSWVAPNGQVFGISAGNYMYYLDPTGTGSIRAAGSLGFTNFGNNGSAVMYRPGRIFLVGGGATTNDSPTSDGRAAVRLININGGDPVVTSATPLPVGRQWANATVLADGQVLVTGGSKSNNVASDATRTAMIWNPETGQWRSGAAGALPRLYHSSAVLLPDGRVFSGGGGAPGPLTNLNAEIYSPPYLFDANGAPAARPGIASAPTTLNWGGGRFAVAMSSNQSIARVSLIALGSNTHSFDMNQRYVPLGFSQSGSALSVDRPASARVVPPGYYMLFAVNGQGVPSVAHVLRVVAGDTGNSPDREGQGNNVGGGANEDTATPVPTQPEPEQSPADPVIPAPSVPAAPDPTACNQLANGDFSNGVSGWSINGSAAMVAGASGNALQINSGSVGAGVPAVVPGRQYQLSGVYTAAGSGGWAGFGIDFFNANGAKIGEAIGDLANRSTPGPFGVSATAPPGASSARIWIYVDAARTVTVDQVQLGPADCNGDQPTDTPSDVPSQPPADQDGTPGQPVVPDSAAGQCTTLANGGFESGAGGWNLPAGAAIVGDAYRGGSALRFTGASVGSQLQSAQPGQQYQLSVQTRVTGAAGWAGVGIDFFDAAGIKLDQGVSDLAFSSAYRQTGLTVIAPAGATQMKVWLFAGAGTTITVDDIVLIAAGCDGQGGGGQVADSPQQTPSVTPPVTGPAPVAGSCNQVADGGFELGTAGWDSNTALATVADAYTGQQALRLSGGWASRDVTASGQSDYRISGFAKSTGSGWAGYGIDFLDAGGAEIGKLSGEFPASGNFGAFETAGLAPAGSRFARLWLFVAGGRTVILDDLSVASAGCVN